MGAVDGSGSVYVAGGVRRPAGWPQVMQEDSYVRKYDSAGSEVWTKEFWHVDDSGGTGDRATGVAVDAAGAVYVTAHIDNYFGQSRSSFLYKLDSAGEGLWERIFKHRSFLPCEAVRPRDGPGGGSARQRQPGGRVTRGGGSNFANGYVSRYGTGGELLWTRFFTVAEYERTTSASSVVVDAASSTYVVGWTSGPLLNEGVKGTGPDFLAKYDSAGTGVWVRQFEDSIGGGGLAGGGPGTLWSGGTTSGTTAGGTSSGGLDGLLAQIGGTGFVPTSGFPTARQQCMEGGWTDFVPAHAFRNQGDCVRFVEAAAARA